MIENFVILKTFATFYINILFLFHSRHH